MSPEGRAGSFDPRSQPSSTVGPEVQPDQRQARVGLLAFTHRFLPLRAASADGPRHTRSVAGEIVQEGWGNPFLHPADPVRGPACCRCRSACDPAVPIPHDWRWRLGAHWGLAMSFGRRHQLPNSHGGMQEHGALEAKIRRPMASRRHIVDAGGVPEAKHNNGSKNHA